MRTATSPPTKLRRAGLAGRPGRLRRAAGRLSGRARALRNAASWSPCPATRRCSRSTWSRRLGEACAEAPTPRSRWRARRATVRRRIQRRSRCSACCDVDAARKPRALHSRRRPQDRALDRAAPHMLVRFDRPATRPTPSSTPTRSPSCTQLDVRAEPMTARRDSMRRDSPRASGYDPNALPVDQAQRLHRAPACTPRERESRRSRCATPRPRAGARHHLADQTCRAHDNSAMDGYALRGAQLHRDRADAVCAVAGTGLAGRRSTAGRSRRRQCVRIMTGAVMPAGPRHRRAAGVHAASTATRSHPSARRRAPGDNRRLAGEDLRAAQAGAARGESCARPTRPARHPRPRRGAGARRLRVAFFSTGDELRSSASRWTRLRLRQQPLHDVRHAHAAGLST